ncbi:MAG: DUF4834 family protein [Flavobacteriales bacterium]|nr:DUF4834 family protein [Flavobacteriales bacterium]
MALLRYLVIFLVIYYGIKLLSRVLMPFFLKYLFKKAGQNMHSQFGAQQQEQQKEEGEVTIQHNADRKSGKHDKKDDSGEYVEFEELD